MAKRTILIVGVDERNAAQLRESLRRLGYGACATAHCGRAALERVARTPPDLALVDLGTTGEVSGPQAAARLGSRFDVPVVFVVAATEGADAGETEDAGELWRRAVAGNPYGCLLRPYADRHLYLTIETALAAHARERARRKEPAELRYQNELMDTAFQSISDGIVVANAAGEFLYVNPAAEQIVGMGITDRPEEEWADTYGAFHPDRETPMATEDLPLLRAIHRGESVDEEDVFIRNANRPDGVYIRVSARPLLNTVGGIRGGVIVFRDVTEQVFAEEALALAFAEGRLEVVETVLHNIGNAINSVTTGVETVRKSLMNDRIALRLRALAAAVEEHREDWIGYLREDPQGRKVLPFIVELAAGYAKHREALLGTVGRVRDRANRIADIVRTQKELGTAGTDRKDVDLHETLAGAVRVQRDSLAKRGIRTTIDCEQAPREIRVRESPFHQMLVNLVKNAIEAIDDLAATRELAEPPQIRITARTERRFLAVEVSDNGIGIGTKDTRVLFAPGYTTKPSGSGLGLHSAANFVIGSGGRIEPLSDGPGTGTTMRVMLPLSKIVPAHPPPGSKRSAGSRESAR